MHNWVQCSVGAHHTGELFSSIIWWTGEPSTHWLHMIEERWVSIGIYSWNRLRILVHTFICGAIITIICAHEVSSVLHSPGSGAGSLGWIISTVSLAYHTAQGTLWPWTLCSGPEYGRYPTPCVSLNSTDILQVIRIIEHTDIFWDTNSSSYYHV